MGTIFDRVRRDFSNDDILEISDTYHAWQGQSDAIKRRGTYKNISGFCHSANLVDLKSNDYVLTPGRYVGAEDELDDSLSFEEKFEDLRKELNEQFIEGRKLEVKITSSLEVIQ